MWTIQFQESNGQAAPSFAAGKVRIGRDPDCELKLPGWRVSNKHAELFVSNDHGICATSVPQAEPSSTGRR